MRRFWLKNKFLILVLAYLLIFVLPILLSGPEVLDDALLVGLE